MFTFRFLSLPPPALSVLNLQRPIYSFYYSSLQYSVVSVRRSIQIPFQRATKTQYHKAVVSIRVTGPTTVVSRGLRSNEFSRPESSLARTPSVPLRALSRSIRTRRGPPHSASGRRQSRSAGVRIVSNRTIRRSRTTIVNDVRSSRSVRFPGSSSTTTARHVPADHKDDDGPRQHGHPDSGAAVRQDIRPEGLFGRHGCQVHDQLPVGSRKQSERNGPDRRRCRSSPSRLS